jgi:hypothetical protein
MRCVSNCLVVDNLTIDTLFDHGRPACLPAPTHKTRAAVVAPHVPQRSPPHDLLRRATMQRSLTIRLLPEQMFLLSALPPVWDAIDVQRSMQGAGHIPRPPARAMANSEYTSPT